MSETNLPDNISQEPVNILFNPIPVTKKDVWEIDLIQILNILVKILEKSEKTNLKVAGIAALSSSLIYRLKVESIFELQRVAMSKKPIHQRTDINIDLINIPYRHESTYPVSLDDLLGLLQNLISTIANPRSRKTSTIFEPIDPPNFDDYFVSLADIIGKYEGLIMKKITETGSTLLQYIIEDLDQLDSIRCFFAILFLARDKKINIQQQGDDIKIIAAQDELQN